MRTIPRVPRLLLLSLVTLGCQEAASPTDPAPPGAVIASDSAVAAAREDCVRITAPGTYTLTRDIIGCPHWSAVQITADDVTLRLNGHRISGFGYEYQMPAIAAGGRNIRILGPGLVEGYLAGATISGVEHFEMREVTFVHTPDYGLWIYGGRDVRIVDNTFTGMNYIAIAGGADSLLIAGNRFDGTGHNGENGLRVSGNALVIRDNHIHDFGFGILVVLLKLNAAQHFSR